MGDLPPLFNHAPPLTCSRWLGDRACGVEGKWHMIWTEHIDNGICCDEHEREARQRWSFYAVHEYRMECSMPGAVFVHDKNICVVDEGLLGLDMGFAVSVGTRASNHDAVEGGDG